ncbi:hypothetical protein [Amycolatopsis sp. CA-230715]|uniref:hypothetical protein n=1 Tax=Amycolatopsis sp. CA-230715 TaxID=2745196 RepID=UPI001C32A688|nr:hypothetical protein [Amycolatopsis sp. CA-230715]QWF79695.1 hypothetical protein HUW46_03104 [Amycolatopsis sp. CA-230715]
MSSDKASEGAEDTTGAAVPDSGAEVPASSEAAEGSAPSNADALPRWLVLGGAAFATAAFLAAALFGILWLVASNDHDADRASERDDVVRVGGNAVKAFTELDYTKPDQYFSRASEAATKEIGDQIKASQEANTKTMSEAKTTTTTRILDLAVEELNSDEGKATFIAALQVEVKQGDKAVQKPMRVEVQMTRQAENGDQVWKLSGIDSVPVVSAG